MRATFDGQRWLEKTQWGPYWVLVPVMTMLQLIMDDDDDDDDDEDDDDDDDDTGGTLLKRSPLNIYVVGKFCL